MKARTVHRRSRIRRSDAHWALTTLCGVAAAGCGRVADEEEHPSAPLCWNGELRLSAEGCGDGGFLVEECSAEIWTATGACSLPSPQCEEAEGVVIPTGEHCDDTSFNLQVMECRGGLYQAGCVCGAAEMQPAPRVGGVFYEVDENGRALHLDGVTYPDELFLGYFGYSTDISHVRCVGRLTSYGSPLNLPGLIAADRLMADDQREEHEGRVVETPMDLASLRHIGYLDILEWPEESLQALSSLEELGGLRVGCRHSHQHLCPRLPSLVGLEGVATMGGVIIEAPELRNLRGLDGLVSVESSLQIFDVKQGGGLQYDFKLESLEGLESLREVGTTLQLPILSARDFDVLGNLEKVGGDLTLTIRDEALICATSSLLSHVEVEGEVTVNRKPFDSYDCD